MRWRAHQTACPRPSGACCRVKAASLGQVGQKRFVFLGLAAALERVVELVGHVEMVLDDALVATGDEDELLDARRARFVDDMLQDRPVDHRQHFLRDRLRGGQETRAEAGDGKDGFANRFVHGLPTFGISSCLSWRPPDPLLRPSCRRFRLSSVAYRRLRRRMASPDARKFLNLR